MRDIRGGEERTHTLQKTCQIQLDWKGAAGRSLSFDQRQSIQPARHFDADIRLFAKDGATRWILEETNSPFPRDRNVPGIVYSIMKGSPKPHRRLWWLVCSGSGLHDIGLRNHGGKSDTKEGGATA